MVNWTCTGCGEKNLLSEGACSKCHIPKPEDSRARLASYSNIFNLDTKSFIIPVRRSVIWIWAVITIAAPALASLAYFIFKHYLQ